MADVGVDQFSTPELRIRLLGRFELSAGSPLQLPVGKATTVVQLLVVRRRSSVPVDEVADVLWDDDPPPGASQNIASLVSRLRRVLGPERITGGRSGYRFETAGCWVDVDEAEQLVREAEAQLRSSRPALAVAASAQARPLFQRGRFLEDEPYAAWADEGRREADDVGLPTSAHRAYPHELSGGMRQRVVIAMALANSPDLLVADEPTTGLDLVTQASVLRVLHDLKDRLGLTVLMITHDVQMVLRVADELVILQDGRVVEQGAAAEVAAAPADEYTRRLLNTRLSTIGVRA